jgi:hypothetical protein
MIFQYASPKERGSVQGLVQFCRGAAAFLISLVMGFAVQFSRSYDPTPVYPLDIKQPVEMARRISDSQTPFAEYLRQTMPAPALEEYGSETDKEKLKKALAGAMTALMEDKDLYSPERFPEDNLTRQSRRMITRVKDKDDLKVLNRALLQDTFREELSPKANYRISYAINIFAALFAGALTLTTRKGKYAQTLKDGGGA